MTHVRPWVTGVDVPASNAITRKKSWTPVGPGLIADLDRLEI